MHWTRTAAALTLLLTIAALPVLSLSAGRELEASRQAAEARAQAEPASAAAHVAREATETKETLAFDLWVHPRNEAYDPKRHYRAPGGELYYHAENDIARGLGKLVVRGDPPVLSADLGRDIWALIEVHGGELRPVVHFDSDGDGRVDRTVRGRVEEGSVWFDSPRMAELDFHRDLWQLGIVYRAGHHGSPELDGRYLASVDSKSAQVELVPVIADVSEGPPAESPPAGLLIYRHRGAAPLSLAAFRADPVAHLEDFEELTREEDDDDWTVKPDGRGRLRTHFEQEDLLLVRVVGDDTALTVEWGDMPLEEYLGERLHVDPDADGCLGSDRSRIASDDGSQQALPNRLLFCPEQGFALFDAPDGYEIVVAAYLGGERIESTEASTSILDNVQLYAREVHPRSPRGRGTGTVSGNLVAGFRDAGRDVVDMGRHLVTGTTRRNVHTGQLEKRTSLLGAVPFFLWELGHARPLEAFGHLFEGVNSGVQIAADAVSVVNNAVLNPVVQSTVGLASTRVADETGHWVGALTQAWARNLPGSERTMDALNPVSLYYHDRAFKPTDYTRTDTQLNIDRVISLANIFGMYAVVSSGGGGGNGGGSNAASSAADSGPAPGAVPTPVAAPPPVVPPPVVPAPAVIPPPLCI